MGKSQIGKCQSSVVLRHTLPDGTAHLDWMIEQADAAAGLMTFRLGLDADLRVPSSIRAERIGEHRRDYLTYEGAVSGGRGHVERVARYGVAELEESESRVQVILELAQGGGRMKWTGEIEIGPHWKFVGVVC